VHKGRVGIHFFFALLLLALLLLALLALLAL
jgi:hypothetical protein